MTAEHELKLDMARYVVSKAIIRRRRAGSSVYAMTAFGGSVELDGTFPRETDLDNRANGWCWFCAKCLKWALSETLASIPHDHDCLARRAERLLREHRRREDDDA